MSATEWYGFLEIYTAVEYMNYSMSFYAVIVHTVFNNDNTICMCTKCCGMPFSRTLQVSGHLGEF